MAMRPEGQSVDLPRGRLMRQPVLTELYGQMAGEILSELLPVEVSSYPCLNKSEDIRVRLAENQLRCSDSDFQES